MRQRPKEEEKCESQKSIHINMGKPKHLARLAGQEERMGRGNGQLPFPLGRVLVGWFCNLGSLRLATPRQGPTELQGGVAHGDLQKPCSLWISTSAHPPPALKPPNCSPRSRHVSALGAIAT